MKNTTKFITFFNLSPTHGFFTRTLAPSNPLWQQREAPKLGICRNLEYAARASAHDLQRRMNAY
jgi:hypothetical protein